MRIAYIWWAKLQHKCALGVTSPKGDICTSAGLWMSAPCYFRFVSHRQGQFQFSQDVKYLQAFQILLNQICLWAGGTLLMQET